MERSLGRNCVIPLILFLLLVMPHLARANVVTEVVVNKSVLLNLQRPSERVSIASPAIAELVVISPTQLQINGKKAGTTSLIVWERGGKTTFFDVRVKGDCAVIQEQIDEVAPNDSIKVDWINDTIILSGKAANDETVAKAVHIAEAYAGKAEGGGQEPKAQESSLDTSRGIAYQSTGIEQLAMAPRPGGEDKVKVVNHVVIDDPQQVILEVKVAQVDKTALKSLGLSMLIKGAGGEGFSNLVGAPAPNSAVQPGTILPPFGILGDTPGMGAITGPKGSALDAFQLGASVFKPGIGAALKALATKGLAKVLAEPNLLVKSGQVGRFLAGSKIPFAYVSGVGALSTTSIQFIDVGIKLYFKPEVLENGLISLRIDPAEVSAISGTLAVNGYPIIDTREVRTKVQLRDGESLVLAGLLQEDTIKTMSKIPVLGDIPILGALFRSTQDDLKEKELMFFITPRLTTPTPKGTATPLPTDVPLTPEQEREFKWIPTTE